jgi:uncharacterized DUF497 family protein/uncharacterized protein (DUF4415 family)
MEFDWHPAKCTKNIAKRGIDFADVLVAFIDPNRRVVEDTRKNYGETRYNVLAKVEGRVVHLTYTERGRVIWIISARQTNGSNGAMKKANRARAVLVDGKPYQKKADGSLVPLKGKTDWKLLDRMTSKQVEAIAAADKEGAPMTDEEWAEAEITTPHKVSVGLRLDDDLLDWFKSKGKGYQTRINTILRRYYETHRKAD